MMILYLLFKLTFLGLLMSSITRFKYGQRKSLLLTVAFHAGLLALNYAIYLLKGTDFLSEVFPVSATLPAFVFFCFVSAASVPKVLFSLLTVTICGTLTSFVGTLPILFYGSVPLRLLTEFACAALISVFIIKVFRKPYLKMTDTLQSGWTLFCLVPALLIAFIYLLQYYSTPMQNRPEIIPVVFLAFALMAVFYAIAYQNFRKISEYYQLKNDRKEIAIQAEMYQRQYDAIRENYDSVRIFRHDMRHHLSAINAFLGDGNIAEAKKYIGRLDSSLTDGIVERYCENYGVNAVLSSLIRRAKSEGIVVECEASIPENLSIDSMELGLVFANALDNAINACGKLESPLGRRITVDCREHSGQLYIRVSNPFAGEVQFDGEFPVASGMEHGVGTRSIAAIAEKYGGAFSFVAQNGVFKTTVTLNYKTPTKQFVR
jgi:signal transduction histidine kinase